MNNQHSLSVKVNDKDNVTALLYSAAAKSRLKATILLGHGAGANQSSSFMKLFAVDSAQRG